MIQIMMDYNRQILLGDVLDKLKEILDNTFDCIISSPPYWGLRDYKVEGQLGLESDFRDYLKTMALIMDELKRVLKRTGSCWINIGDTYSTGNSGMPQPINSTNDDNNNRYGSIQNKTRPNPEKAYGIKSKSRMGIPARFYINCIDSGWIARNDIIWYKLNSMPQSVKDRLLNKWEYIFFFVKSNQSNFSYNEQTGQSTPEPPKIKRGGIDWEYITCTTCNGTGTTHTGDKHKRCNGNGIHRYSFWNSVDYYFNLNAIREKAISQSKTFNIRVRENITGKAQQKMGDKSWTASDEEMESYNKDGTKKDNLEIYGDDKGNRRRVRDGLDIYREKLKQDSTLGSKGKNPGDVFFINPKPFTEAHFATFPVELPEYILKCACPQQVCSKCGIPRYPISKPTEEYQQIINDRPWKNKGDYNHLEKGTGLASIPNYTHNYSAEYQTVEYTKCNCNEKFIPGIVLDPFMGAGTTAVAAEQAGLRWCGIELKEEYCVIARKRLEPYITQERMG